MRGAWRVWVDTGGTFTDCVALDPEGRLRRIKVLSSSSLRGTVAAPLGPRRLRLDAPWELPDGFFDGCRFHLLDRPDGEGAAVIASSAAGREVELDRELDGAEPGARCELVSAEEAPVLAARMITRTPGGEALPAMALRLATTRGTNALLERRGAPTALFVTAGFEDLLEIGTQQRSDLFALAVEKQEPLYDAVVGVPGRLDAAGHEVEALRRGDLEEAVAELAARGVTSAAVALAHSYREPAHEEELAAWLRRRGFAHVARSSELAPLIRLLPRAETAVIDAYLGPVIEEYLERVGGALAAGTVHVMTSAGGLAGAADYRAKDSLLSGPAGGVVGAAAAGRRAGFERLIAFDMGGTSTDVSRFDGDFQYAFETRVAGARLLAPGLAIETVAAGGGSICAFDGAQLKVGPSSAGARPGPACYGAGGPLTLTDVNLLLGRLVAERFEIPIDRDAARRAAEELAAGVREARGGAVELAELLAGFLEIADERMADAIRRISVREGYDPAEYALVAFGGAGGQHACALAELLGMESVVVPADAALLSAVGLGDARVERFAQRQVLEPLAEAEARVEEVVEELAERVVGEVAAEGVPRDEVEVRRRLVELRFVGQDSTITVELGGPHDDRGLEERFAAAHQELFGFRPGDRPVEVESVRVVASSRRREVEAPGVPEEARPPESVGERRMVVGGEERAVGLYDRAALAPGSRFAGPALVLERHSTTLVAEGWECRVDAGDNLVLERREAGNGRAAGPSRPEAVELELFTNRFVAVAHEMGERLRRTALSTNVKERLDFSCGLFDPAGELVVNAPHIPVHLGAMGLCVRRVAEALELAPGDVAVTNHPAFGGSHLPDVTVITPVHEREDGGELLGWVASRAHHAEIGGARPGSMPPAARRLAEEGVVISPRRLLVAGEPRWDEMRELLEGGRWPSRSVAENLADLAAAVAANHRGGEALRALAGRHGRARVAHFMEALTAQAAERIRAALGRLEPGERRAEERLDDGSPLAVTLTIGDGRARFDFTGSAGVHPGNLNATPAVVRSVVLYVLRLLIGEPLPLNEGLLRPVELILPEGLLNPPFPDDPEAAPAVVGGNVETSQRLVDLLLKALRLAAASQGTMNNLLFGDGRRSYYETVCGGCGAGPGFHGASAVHSHMTNTAITDPEVLEHRYPVRLERFAVRRGSGGAGRWSGGDGVVRELRFLAPLSVSLLTQHRTAGPYGCEGGEAGAPGRQRLVRAGGGEEELEAIDAREVEAGDRLILETPGGGGWGEPGEPGEQGGGGAAA